MRSILFLLNINLFIFILMLIFSFYVIYIDNIDVLIFELDFLRELQLGSHIEKTNNSIRIAIILSFIAFFVSVIINLKLMRLYINTKKRRIFNFIHKKNKILFELGIWSVNPFLIKERMIQGRSKFFLCLQLILYSWIVLFITLFIANIEFIQLPKAENLIFLVTNYKEFLFIFNVILFTVVSFMYLGFVLVWIFTFISIFNIKEI